MDRKKFISTCMTAGLAIPAAALEPATHRIASVPAGKRPPYLKKGDVIGITSPSGYLLKERVNPAMNRLQEWGFRVKLGDAIGQRSFSFGGSDDIRLKDFQQLLDDDSVKAILCARGGYGLNRIIDQLDFTRFQQSPKWIIGFSDITVLHNHLNYQFGIPSIHAKMCNSFPDNWNTAPELQRATIESIHEALKGKRMEYTVPPSVFNRKGTSKGVLVGGNLKIIESMAGTPSDLDTRGKILFVEDVGEMLYSIDRMFWNLLRSGKLDQLAGLIIGGFRVKEDTPDEPFGFSLPEIVMEKVRRWSFPVCFDFPVGHQLDNFALKCGVEHELTVSDEGATLLEDDG